MYDTTYEILHAHYSKIDATTRKNASTCSRYVLITAWVLTMSTTVTCRMVFPVVFLMYIAIGTMALGELIECIEGIDQWEYICMYSQNVNICFT